MKVIKYPFLAFACVMFLPFKGEAQSLERQVIGASGTNVSGSPSLSSTMGQVVSFYTSTSSQPITLVFHGFQQPQHFDFWATGIEDGMPLSNEIGIYPNPIEKTLTIEFENRTSVSMVICSDLSGREVFRQEIESTLSAGSQFVIGLPEMPDGLYSLHVFDTSHKPLLTKLIQKGN